MLFTRSVLVPSSNTVANGSIGIDSEADDISVTSNKIFGSTTGILSFTSVPAIQSNTITDSPIGIDLFCNANSNVHSNILTDVGIALYRLLPAMDTSNTYFNVGTIRARDGC